MAEFVTVDELKGCLQEGNDGNLYAYFSAVVTSSGVRPAKKAERGYEYGIMFQIVGDRLGGKCMWVALSLSMETDKEGISRASRTQAKLHKWFGYNGDLRGLNGASFKGMEGTITCVVQEYPEGSGQEFAKVISFKGQKKVDANDWDRHIGGSGGSHEDCHDEGTAEDSVDDLF